VNGTLLQAIAMVNDEGCSTKKKIDQALKYVRDSTRIDIAFSDKPGHKEFNENVLKMYGQIKRMNKSEGLTAENCKLMLGKNFTINQSSTYTHAQMSCESTTKRRKR